MPSPHEDTAPESSYPSLMAPHFQSQIPDYLLKDASEQDKHIMSQLSILTQVSEWSVKAHISTMDSVRKTNGRLIRAEGDIEEMKDDKHVIKVGWKVIVAIIGGIGGLLALGATIYSAVRGGG